MGTDYKLLVKDTTGDVVAECGDFLALSYSKEVNKPGVLEFQLRGSHSLVGTLALNYQVEVYRRNADMGLTDWTCDFYGLYRYSKREYTDHDLFTARCPGQMWWLGTRVVAYYKGLTDLTTFTAIEAETIMKTLVSYNLGSNATTGNARLRNGNMTGISEEADGGNGTALDWECSFANLLTTLQDIAKVGGGDFDLVKTGGATWEFRWYTGQRGTDRSATVIFSLPWGNMENPVYTDDRIDEASVAVVGGAGEYSDRYTSIVEGTDYHATANNVEVFVDARDTETADARTDRGNEGLDTVKRKQELTFGVLQTPACFYGVHYGLGDKVTALHSVSSGTYKINRVDVSMSDQGEETIDIKLEATA